MKQSKREAHTHTQTNNNNGSGSSNNNNNKKLPTANFSFGCSLSLCPFSLFLGFSFLSKVFPIQFFFMHPSLSVRVLRDAHCPVHSFVSYSHSTGPLKETTPRLRYPKSKHTFFSSTFSQDTCFPFLFSTSYFIFFYSMCSLFRSVFHLCSTSFIVTGSDYTSHNNTLLAHAHCTYIWLYASYLVYIFIFLLFFQFVVNARMYA